jgi:hypothetical protein
MLDGSEATKRMIRYIWTCGNTYRDEEETVSIINNGRIEPELEYVGFIEEACYVGFRLRKDPLDHFEIVVTFLLANGGIRNAPDFVNALLRIYAAPDYITRNYPGIPNSFEEYCAANPACHGEIDFLVGAYLAVLPHEDIEFPPDLNINAHQVRLELCKEIATKLHFDAVYTANLHAYTRTRYACTHADAEYYFDVVARVRCEGCERAFTFRLAFYKTYKVGWVGQKVYRVPGLSCDGFPGHGMCLIMDGTLIRGRTTFGTLACECRIRQRVLVQ